MLVRLLYASRLVENAPAVIEKILQEARQHNHECCVTGVLVHANGAFLQVLEGERKAVSDLYTRILRDKRHKDVELLSFADIDERRFAQWSMGQVDISHVNSSVLLKYLECAQLNPHAVAGKNLLALLDELIATANVISHS